MFAKTLIREDLIYYICWFFFQVIAKTFSGMFNKISTISAPSRSDELRPKVHSKSKGHSKVESRDVSDGQSLKDLDAVSVEYGFLHSDQVSHTEKQSVLCFIVVATYSVIPDHWLLWIVSARDLFYPQSTQGLVYMLTLYNYSDIL